MDLSKVVIVGAGGAGLACAALLKKGGVDSVILESASNVASRWRSHYDRLHLHTNRGNSTLPGLKYPKGTPKYPSRDQVVSYMEDYSTQMGLKQIFNQKVISIEKNSDSWHIRAENGEFNSEFVIVCTGKANEPQMASNPGQDTFIGDIMHSADYKNGKAYKNKNVLVVGFGNSACEIAIDLYEHGATPSLSVRSAVNVVPRDILGIPVLQIGIIQGGLPPRISDTLNKPLLKFLIGDIEKYGLRKLPYGPREQIISHGRIPLLDIGTMKLIKNGSIRIFGDIDHIDENTVHFEKQASSDFDAIIFATGYRSGIEKIVSLNPERLEDIRKPIAKRKMEGNDNIYFCGYYISPTGMLREINIESKAIVRNILKRSE